MMILPAVVATLAALGVAAASKRRGSHRRRKRCAAIGEHDARLGGRNLLAQRPNHAHIEAPEFGAWFVHQWVGVDLRPFGTGERPKRHLPATTGEAISDLGPEDLATSPLRGGDEKQEAGIEGDGVSRSSVRSS